MRQGRALTLMLAIAGTALIVVGARFAHRDTGSNVAADAANGAGDPSTRTTIRFFKDPEPVAAFTAADLDGRTISSSSYSGKVIIVNFWATWCPPCRAEIPDLIALQEKYRDRLQIVGISEDEDSVDDVKRFVAEHRINYPIVMSTPELTKLFPGVHALPTSFILDTHLRLVQKHVGMLRAGMTELETRALAGLPVNASVEHVERAEGLKLENGAQLMNIPGVELASLSKVKRGEALQKLNEKSCTCGCDLTVAKCRVDDPSCGVSLPLAREIVKQIASQ
jgi:thiol-disulfide isomerase/thioredoxin